MRTKLNNLIMPAFLVVVLSAAAFAQTPLLINYQGRVLDAAGAPVSDGPHIFDFAIYDMSAAGLLLWSEPGIAINTSGGLFTYALSSSVAFPFNLFTGNLELWLEVTVDGQVQTPRTRLISNPYAETAGNLSYLNPFTGFLGWKTDASNNQFSTYGGDGQEQIRLWGGSWGEILLHDADPTNDLTAVLTANPSSGGQLILTDNGGFPTIDLHGGQTGNTSVEFPTDAIDADEMLNEPGIVHAFDFSGTGALATTDSLVDSIVVDVPTSGFLYVSATGWFQVSHVIGTGDKVGRAWVSETKPINFDNFTIWSLASSYGSDIVYAPFAISYVKSVSAGETVLFLMADQPTGTGISVERTHLTAQFFPTPYGTVEATKIATTDQDGLASESGSELVPAEIYDASLAVIAELEAEREALRADNERLRFEKEQLRETQQKISGATPNKN